MKQKSLISIRQELQKRYVYSKELSKVNVADCQIYKRGEVWVIELDDKVLYYETHSANYPFFEDAYHCMEIKKKASWKTVGNLIAFRHAIREDAVNWRGFSEILEEPLTKKSFDFFMKLSRAADVIHHDQQTF